MSNRTPETLDSTSPGIQVVTDSQCRGLVRAMLDSRQWWLLPWLNQDAAELSIAIEERYYSGEANADFAVFLGPAPLTAARKCRMSPKQLGVLLAELCSEQGWTAEQWREAVSGQDILVAVPNGADEIPTLARLVAWHDWLLEKVPA